MSAGAEPRTSSSGQTMTNLQPLSDPAAFDYIAICGGNDYEINRAPDALLEWLRLAVNVRTRLVGICTGTFTLAQADVVGPRTVCVHWNVLDVFRARFPKVSAVVDRLFIDEGDLITCAGSTAAVDLGLYLVGRHCGRDKAQQAMRHMMLQGIRPAHMPQPHFYEDLAHLEDVRVRQAAHFIEQRVDNPPSLDAIARYVGVSARQLERAFNAALGMSPMAFYRHVRLQYGRWLLLNNAGSITRIAHDCGYADGAHFSREFSAHFGMSPRSFLKQSQNRCDNVSAIASPVL